MASFAINGRGYIAFGYSTICTVNCNLISYRDIWEYSPGPNSWRKVATVEGDTRLSISMVIGGKAYILGQNKLLEFDPVTYSVVEKSPFGAVANGSAFSIGNKGYIVGSTGSAGTRRVYEYDVTTDRWTQKRDFPGEYRVSPVGFALSGYGYYGGGVNNIFPSRYLKDFWRYDAAGDEWTRLEDYPGLGANYLSGAVVGSQAIIGLGEGSPSGVVLYNNDFWRFQPN